jgi:hypothetical protein
MVTSSEHAKFNLLDAMNSRSNEDVLLTGYSIPLMFHTRMEPSLDAVITSSEFGAKHKQVTAL